MINIGIIDDEKNIRDVIEKRISQLLIDKNHVRIHTYESGKAFFAAVDAGIRFHIVFSDIEMPDMDGLELGKRLKKKWSNVYLIFLTSHPQFAMNSYLLNAHQYIMKEDMQERLPEIVLDVVEKVEKELDAVLVLGSLADQRRVYCSDVLYFLKDKGTKYVEYVTETERIRDYKSMEQAIEQMEHQDFIQIERRYMVNMRHIVRVKGDTITLSNGEQLPVSRRRITYVKEQMNDFWGTL